MEKLPASYIDHTILNPDATRSNVKEIIDEAKQYKFASVCVNPHWVEYSAHELTGTSVEVCTVIGFPLGATSTATKVFECKQAIEAGATEIDVVINVGELKSNNDEFVKQDLAAVVEAAKDKAIVKVIIETSLLTDVEKIRASLLSQQVGADFVKTSTGFSSGGATIEDIKLMRSTIGPEMGIKASGGIRTLAAMQNMIEAGATRIGASAGVAIMEEYTNNN